jgi:hypothetical protein
VWQVRVEQLALSPDNARLYYLADSKIHALDLPTASFQPSTTQGDRPRY